MLFREEIELLSGEGGGEMKTGKHFLHKKRMARVAKPLLEVFLSEETPEEREKVFRKAIKKTREMTKFEKEYYFKNDLLAGVGNRTETIYFIDVPSYGMCGHELMHFIRKFVNNDNVLASAVERYLGLLDSCQPIAKALKIDDTSFINVSSIDNLRPLTIEERINPEYEYRNKHNETGRDIGYKAALIDGLTGLYGAGLFYLKLIDSGVPIEEAERKVLDCDVLGLKEFSRKYGKRLLNLSKTRRDKVGYGKYLDLVFGPSEEEKIEVEGVGV